LRPNGGAAFSIAPESASAETVVIVFEMQPTTLDANFAEIFTAIRAVVADIHEIEAPAIVLIEPASLPKTTSGKVQRARCRELFLQQALSIVAQDLRLSVPRGEGDHKSAADQLPRLHT